RCGHPIADEATRRLTSHSPNEKGPRDLIQRAFLLRRRSRYERTGGLVGIVILTVSPLRPGNPVNIASTRLGITTSRRFVSERAWARPSNSGALVPAARMWRSIWL